MRWQALWHVGIHTLVCTDSLCKHCSRYRHLLINNIEENTVFWYMKKLEDSQFVVGQSSPFVTCRFHLFIQKYIARPERRFSAFYWRLQETHCRWSNGWWRQITGMYRDRTSRERRTIKLIKLIHIYMDGLSAETVIIDCQNLFSPIIIAFIL